MTEANAAVF